ncbi:MAG: glycosyltransferase family 39 protein, partial [Anaerolineae bacterium]|nr:glycosyltransferase family 39 protein [Anaerolineae bacterium]
MTRARDIGLTSILLLLYLGLRLHHLLALPLFIDETLHAERAVSVWQGSPLWFGANGKLLGAWWIALFDPFPAQPWLLRASILLLTLLGAAAAMTLARRLYGPAAALLAGLLICFAPMLFFFDRMSLADTTLHPLLTLFVLSLFWLLDDGPLRRWRAILSGVLLAAAILAKATAITITPLPLLAVWILARGWRTADRLKALGWLFGTVLI